MLGSAVLPAALSASTVMPAWASVQGMHLHVTADGGQAHVVDLRQHIAIDAVEGQRQANRHRHRDTAAGQ
jgi:hypothetical protein